MLNFFSRQLDRPVDLKHRQHGDSNMNPTTRTLDARGLNCPLPILRTRKAMAGLAAGEVLEVTASDPGSVKDMESFCSQTGHQLLTSDQQDGAFVFRIRKV